MAELTENRWSKWNSIFIIFVFLLTAVCSTTYSQQSQERTVRPTLLVKTRQLNNYEHDFLSFANANKGTDEFQTAIDFINIASKYEDRISAVLDLIDVYDEVTCKPDRSRIKGIIETKIRKYADGIDDDVELLNLGLGITKSPGIAATGTRFKEDLRNLKTVLHAIELKP